MIRLVLAFLLAALPAHADRLQELGTFTWRIHDRTFGGLSGLAITEGGTHLLAVTDRGRFLTATIQRDGDRITDLTNVTNTPVRKLNGDPTVPGNFDAEGLAVGADGTIFVSFEGFGRVRSYASVNAKAGRIPEPNIFHHLQTNSGLEALAIDAGGALYAVPERSGEWERPFPVFRYRNGTWDADLSIPRSKKFLPTGADFGPDGRFYLLERDTAGILGFKSRIRRFDLGPSGFTNETTLLETAAGTYDNLEGISLWRDAGGRIRLTLVSDDNFFPFQKTQLVEFALIED